MEDCSIGQSAVVWVRKPNFGSFFCGEPFVCQVRMSSDPSELFIVSYCAWLWNWLIFSSEMTKTPSPPRPAAKVSWSWTSFRNGWTNNLGTLNRWKKTIPRAETVSSAPRQTWPARRGTRCMRWWSGMARLITWMARMFEAVVIWKCLRCLFFETTSTCRLIYRPQWWLCFRGSSDFSLKNEEGFFPWKRLSRLISTPYDKTPTSPHLEHIQSVQPPLINRYSRINYSSISDWSNCGRFNCSALFCFFILLQE